MIFKNGVPADANGDCAPGTYVSEIDGRTCILCQAGTFSNTTNASGVANREDQEIGCRRCPPGFVQPEAGASNCIKCEPGTEPGEFEQKCVKPQNRCEIGFSIVRQYRRSYDCEMDTCDQAVELSHFKGRVCGMCGSGHFTKEDGQCERCPATSLGDGLRCAQCPNGTVRFGSRSRYGETCACRGPVALNRGMINGSCQLCPAGSYGAPKGNAVPDHECRKCPAGTYRNFVDENSIAAACSNVGRCNALAPCKACEAGFFSDEDGATECKPCPPGTFSYGMGETECLEFGAASRPVPFDEPISGSSGDGDGEVASPEAGEAASPESSEEEELVMPSGE
ncbi:hypothetical protein BWQ96_07817 [Gracilariopsis chorda]|uniref:Tyrosine-protein kinase ephrin type A/B receptor-like domain-containing protein n=1 Tax=Gracilariopsis chorda TaxID=448386 RepID=A0A2V3IK62_9FLOR|nr:hypothetical protein BWQ96_07817 [Gracilariopsis chorda]|eukprot:PXF42439.1 hypothetical protein BWQ96_07817 [Gracilariopsis chorda]